MREIFEKTNTPEKYVMAHFVSDIYNDKRNYKEYFSLKKSLFPDFLRTQKDQSANVTATSNREITKPNLNWLARIIFSPAKASRCKR